VYTFPQFKTVVLSDVSLGYGTPQVLSLSKSLQALFQSRVTILEPDEPERPPVDLKLDDTIEVRRLYTATHPYSPSGQVEFNMHALAELETLKPDVVVLCAFLGAGSLLRMKHKPKIVIYYGLEHTDGTRPFEQNLIRMCADKIDLSVFPEENRALFDTPRLGLDHTPYVVVYNGSSTEVTPLPADARNGKFFYGGLLHPTQTFADYFLDGALDSMPIDLYGIVKGYPSQTDKTTDLVRRGSRVSYGGYLPSGPGYMNMLRSYDFSIVIWNPTTESTLYAAPNKFFDAIQAGVPIVAAPHPLCKKLIQRYQCGITLNGFSLGDLRLGLRQAQALRNSDEYAEMVEKNLPKARADLNWDAQFAKIEEALSNLLKARDKRRKAL